MAQSKVNDEYTYQEDKFLAPSDKGQEAPLYYIELFGKKVVISVSPNLVQDIEEVNAYPVYLINDTMDKVINRIGYYELDIEEEPVKDNDGDIDLEQFDEPIIFDYVKTSDYEQILEENTITTDILKSKTKLGSADLEEKEDDEDDEEEEEEEEEEEDEDEDEEEKQEEKVGEVELPFKNFEEMKNMILMINKDPVNNQTKTEADNEVSSYQGGNNKSWIKNFMKSDNYAVEEVTGDGSCFFYCIARVILSLLGIKLKNEKDENDENIITIVELLREKTANNYNLERVDALNNMYSSAKQTINDIENQINELLEKINKNNEELDKYNTIKQKVQNNLSKSTNDDEEIKRLNNKNKRVDNKINNITKEKSELEGKLNMLQENLKEEKSDFNDQLGWYTGVKNDDDDVTLTNLKEKVKSEEFWADEFTLIDIEEALKLRLTFFNKENIDSNDNFQNITNSSGILTCRKGEIDNEDEDSIKFYVLLEYTGNHYNLVTYKNIKGFHFTELPYNLKEMLNTDNCYRQSFDFKKYNQEI